MLKNMFCHCERNGALAKRLPLGESNGNSETLRLLCPIGHATLTFRYAAYALCARYALRNDNRNLGKF